MVKFKTTDSEIKGGFARVIKIGYCDAQYLLNFENPIAYNCGVYGWRYDIYQFEGYGATCICTGYSPIGNVHIDYKIIRKYDDKAQKIQNDQNLTFEQKKKKTKKLLKKFIDFCIKQYENQ